MGKNASKSKKTGKKAAAKPISEPKETAAERGGLSQRETAERLGLSVRHIRNLVLEGFPKDGEGPGMSHPWPKSREWYNDYIRKQERKKQPDDDLKELRRRRYVADLRLAEIEVEEAEGRLIPFDVLESRVGSLCDRIRAVLMTIPSKYLSRIQVARTDLEAQAVGEQIRDETLRALQGTADDVDDQLELPEPLEEKPAA